MSTVKCAELEMVAQVLLAVWRRQNWRAAECRVADADVGGGHCAPDGRVWQ
jgi:hypothetical protein